MLLFCGMPMFYIEIFFLLYLLRGHLCLIVLPYDDCWPPLDLFSVLTDARGPPTVYCYYVKKATIPYGFAV